MARSSPMAVACSMSVRVARPWRKPRHAPMPLSTRSIGRMAFAGATSAGKRSRANNKFVNKDARGFVFRRKHTRNEGQTTALDSTMKKILIAREHAEDTTTPALAASNRHRAEATQSYDYA